MENNTPYKYFTLIASGVAGVLLVYHARTISSEYPNRNEESAMNLSYQVLDMARSNTEILEELYRLKVKDGRLTAEQQDKTKSRQSAQDRLVEYKRYNGTEPVVGAGVEIVVKGDLVTEEVIDLVNGIRNIKPTAIGINGRRVSYRSYFIVADGKIEFDDKKYDFPFSVQVIGNPEDIRKTLARSGGVLDVIKKNSYGKADFDLIENSVINLPAYDKKLQFRFARKMN